ncbi:MAG: hypothetical protein IKV94_05800 [Clostridia bacterium]|nr:hypothetical protein [Clostridia bacterium]
MIKGKWKILICTLLVACILFVTSNDVFAAINEEYYYNNVAPNEVVDAQLDNKLKDNILIDALGSLIYGIGSLMEWVLGTVFKAITKTSIFPWADSILFNAIPFLDVNVFTAAEGSLVASLQGFIAGMYYTILTLANTFFGLAIMVTAIKLVLTAIAEEKAKYKKAIVDWILGLVMLWGIHFFISFALYLNEELVKAASTMASTSLEKAESDIILLADTSEYNETIVSNFVNLMEKSKTTVGDVFGFILKAIGAILIIAGVVLISIASGRNTYGSCYCHSNLHRYRWSFVRAVEQYIMLIS